MAISAKRFFSVWRSLVPYALIFLFVLFFIGGPDYYSSRHFKAVWNLGHILFFALLPYETFRHLLKKRADGFTVQSMITIGACIVLGAAVELVQFGFQRTPDMGDMFRDIIGGLVGIFFLLPSRKRVQKRLLRAFQAITVCLVGLQVYPVVIAFCDEYLAREQFPVLSSFETPWEIQRWRGDADFAMDDSVQLEGKHSMRVLLGTDLYSGVSLFYFRENWEGATGFRFSVYNPSEESLAITCRINDQAHNEGRRVYEDRFNHRYSLPKGWSTIAIGIEDIREAPKGRQMDLRHIKGVGFFATQLPRVRVIYIDDVRLVF